MSVATPPSSAGAAAPFWRAWFCVLVSAIATASFAQTNGGGGGGNRGGGGNAGGVIGGGGGVIIGGGGIVPGGGGNTGGTGGITRPIFPLPGNGDQSDVRITTDAGVLVGVTNQASATIPSATAADAATATFQWSIGGGRITSDPSRQSISYVADAVGTVTLSVQATVSGMLLAGSTDIAVFSPADAGAISTAATVVTGASGATATVPAAKDGDRTFRWALGGVGGAITAGQGTNSITFRPGAPGLLELTCFVTLQRLASVPVRSFVVVSGNGDPVAVTINNGAGSGTYPAGSRINLFALPPAAGEVFDRWTGDTAALGTAEIAPLQAHAVLTVPDTPVTLTATYKAAPGWTPTVVTNFNPQTIGSNPTAVTTTLRYYIPDSSLGIVFLLHGSDGGASSWFSNPEQLTLARDLVAAGYGVAALNSVNRTSGWSSIPALANNPDASNLAAALDLLVRDRLITPALPVFLLGFAQGGDAAARYAELLATTAPERPVKGVVLYCATGGQTLPITSHVPHLFALAANDDGLGTSGSTLARDNAQLLAGRAVPTAVISNPVSPVPAERLRVLGVNGSAFTQADAEAIWNALKTAGLLAANNYLQAVPSADQLRAVVPSAYASRLSDIAAQLRVAYAAQEFFSDANAPVIEFLNRRVADAPATPAGRLVNLSTRAQIAFAGDTFVLGFNLEGPERATVLIRGLGPALRRFGLDGALGAARLEVSQGGRVLASNAGWDSGTTASAAQVSAAASAVGAFALTAGSRDAAVLLTLDPGSYTATLQGINSASGEVLAEVYDVSRNATRLTGLAMLGSVTEGEPLVPGMVVAGNSPRTLMVRAIGPGLTAFGLSGDVVLGQPRVVVLNSQGQSITNSQSQTAGSADAVAAGLPAVGAFPQPASADASVVNAFTPGAYTLQVAAAPLSVAAQASANFIAPNQTGTVLVEIYEVP